MGQIAACLTDLICLIEQRDAFGFASPSKAADSASVKKNRGRGEKGKEKHPRDISAAAGADLHTRAASGGGLFVSVKLRIRLPRRAGSFRSSAANNGHKLGESAAVIDQRLMRGGH